MAKLHHYYASLRTSAGTVVAPKRLHHYFATLTSTKPALRLHHYYASLSSQPAPKRLHHYYASLSTSRPGGNRFWFHNGGWRARKQYKWSNGQWVEM